MLHDKTKLNEQENKYLMSERFKDASQVRRTWETFLDFLTPISKSIFLCIESMFDEKNTQKSPSRKRKVNPHVISEIELKKMRKDRSGNLSKDERKCSKQRPRIWTEEEIQRNFKIINGDAMNELCRFTKGSIANVITGIPDLNEMGNMNETDYTKFLKKVTRKIFNRVDPNGYAIFVQTNRKIKGKLIDKSYIISDIANKSGYKTM